MVPEFIALSTLLAMVSIDTLPVIRMLAWQIRPG
jgi:hypothetical protein